MCNRGGYLPQTNCLSLPLMSTKVDGIDNYLCIPIIPLLDGRPYIEVHHQRPVNVKLLTRVIKFNYYELLHIYLNSERISNLSVTKSDLLTTKSALSSTKKNVVTESIFSWLLICCYFYNINVSINICNRCIIFSVN